ncbi:hypothetical protein [Aliiruegeria sabulilitoris]|uniref:hypothetical protein n=1 Tax=Aliiruegeria sabulilitoris TaxID=1510458 RepID=UPI000829EA52|nr:hypothetical protein [Aliiruegeria sabulilitoris]NDR59725.1 hypothetical protein [Pseudoruegeria sp. M32A2M]
MNILRASAVSLCLILPGLAAAGPFADFEGELRQAYGAYRAALFQTNMGNAEASTASIKGFVGQWKALEEGWKASPPPQYEDDAGFAATVEAVSQIAQRADAQIAAGELAEAHETLEEIRDQIGEMRQRNGQIGFSDRMNAYHEKMEHVLMAGYAQKGPDALPALAAEAAVLQYLAGEIAANPAPDASDPAFEKLVAGLLASVQALDAAAAAGDWDAAKAAVAGLKKPYAMLFMKFG